MGSKPLNYLELSDTDIASLTTADSVKISAVELQQLWECRKQYSQMNSKHTNKDIFKDVTDTVAGQHSKVAMQEKSLDSKQQEIDVMQAKLEVIQAQNANLRKSQKTGRNNSFSSNEEVEDLKNVIHNLETALKLENANHVHLKEKTKDILLQFHKENKQQNTSTYVADAMNMNNKYILDQIAEIQKNTEKQSENIQEIQLAANDPVKLEQLTSPPSKKNVRGSRKTSNNEEDLAENPLYALSTLLLNTVSNMAVCVSNVKSGLQEPPVVKNNDKKLKKQAKMIEKLIEEDTRETLKHVDMIIADATQTASAKNVSQKSSALHRHQNNENNEYNDEYNNEYVTSSSSSNKTNTSSSSSSSSTSLPVNSNPMDKLAMNLDNVIKPVSNANSRVSRSTSSLAPPPKKAVVARKKARQHPSPTLDDEEDLEALDDMLKETNKKPKANTMTSHNNLEVSIMNDTDMFPNMENPKYTLAKTTNVGRTSSRQIIANMNLSSPVPAAVATPKPKPKTSKVVLDKDEDNLFDEFQFLDTLTSTPTLTKRVKHTITNTSTRNSAPSPSFESIQKSAITVPKLKNPSATMDSILEDEEHEEELPAKKMVIIEPVKDTKPAIAEEGKMVDKKKESKTMTVTSSSSTSSSSSRKKVIDNTPAKDDEEHSLLVSSNTPTQESSSTVEKKSKKKSKKETASLIPTTIRRTRSAYSNEEEAFNALQQDSLPRLPAVSVDVSMDVNEKDTHTEVSVSPKKDASKHMDSLTNDTSTKKDADVPSTPVEPRRRSAKGGLMSYINDESDESPSTTVTLKKHVVPSIAPPSTDIQHRSSPDVLVTPSISTASSSLVTPAPFVAQSSKFADLALTQSKGKLFNQISPTKISVASQDEEDFWNSDMGGSLVADDSTVMLTAAGSVKNMEVRRRSGLLTISTPMQQTKDLPVADSGFLAKSTPVISNFASKSLMPDMPKANTAPITKKLNPSFKPPVPKMKK